MYVRVIMLYICLHIHHYSYLLLKSKFKCFMLLFAKEISTKKWKFVSLMSVQVLYRQHFRVKNTSCLKCIHKFVH